MATTADRLCRCGSGRTPARCHDAPRKDRRRNARVLHALGEAHDIAFLFPSVRPSDAAIGDFAEEAAVAVGANTPVPPDVAERGLELLDQPERRRIVDGWAGPYRDRWEQLCAAVGDRATTERTVAASAVRGAIMDRCPPPRELVASLDDGGLRGSPGAAVSLVLSPWSVWSFEDALEAAGVAANGRSRDRLAIVEDVAAELITRAHVVRFRRQAARVAGHLPLAELPTASATLAAGCELIAAHAALARAAAGALLAAYVAQLPNLPALR